MFVANDVQNPYCWVTLSQNQFLPDQSEPRGQHVKITLLYFVNFHCLCIFAFIYNK